MQQARLMLDPIKQEHERDESDIFLDQPAKDEYAGAEHAVLLEKPSSCNSRSGVTSPRAKPGRSSRRSKGRKRPDGRAAEQLGAGKRARSSSPTVSQADEDEDDDAEQSDKDRPKSFHFFIADTDKFAMAYTLRLEQLQQLICKMMLKSWIKVVEPKKQAKYPYNTQKIKRSQKQARTSNAEPEMPQKIPPWWPIDGVRHIEPDHLLKEERLKLGVHLLRIGHPGQMFDPGDAAPYWTDKLEDSTRDCNLQTEEGERGVEKGAVRGSLLKTLYDFARMEESYLRGEMDADTLVSVTDLKKNPYQAQRARTSAGAKDSPVKRQASLSPTEPDEDPELLFSTAQLGLRDNGAALEFEQETNGICFGNLRTFDPPESLRGGAEPEVGLVRSFDSSAAYDNPYAGGQSLSVSRAYDDPLPARAMAQQMYGYDVKGGHQPCGLPSPYYAVERQPTYSGQPSPNPYGAWQVPAQPSLNVAPTSAAPFAAMQESGYGQSSLAVTCPFPGQIEYSYTPVQMLSPNDNYPFDAMSNLGISSSTTCAPRGLAYPGMVDLMGVKGQSLAPTGHMDSPFRTGSLSRPSDSQTPHGLPDPVLRPPF
ncbi:hypothetical protein W97_05261 [Coniosporium apollinis CBS 100218]|uniref:Subtelomeric hrmA-associated cluster protein AFUB-079030/YDR124W-like helical bundle domain-containing protein n=1 Tax=Coniosporium apollinis (strain CBS 100218) TaxID=1168221 RepID=R7YVZ4_CONA1|nr:uncharacterized protein W97_05261 [Coniosporium apollinis CBS 100218]EON66018.1 hypothetical protein W97_05261 [Coniosporium apollinis CBS 100218]